MNSIVQVAVSTALLIAAIVLIVAGFGTGCGGLLAIGLMHGLGSLTLLAQVCAHSWNSRWLQNQLVIAWFGCTAASVLILIKVLPIESHSAPQPVWTVCLMVIAGVCFVMAQILDIDRAERTTVMLRQCVLYELMTFSLIMSGVIRFEHSGFLLGSAGDLLVRIWTVALSLDGCVRITCAFLDGTSIADALGRLGFIRAILSGFIETEVLNSDNPAPVTGRQRIPRQGIGQLAFASAVALSVIAWLFTGVVVIRPNERGIRIRLGIAEPIALEPGLHFGLPYPLAHVQRVATRQLRNQTIGFSAPPQELKSLRLLWTAEHGQLETPFLIGDGTELVAINAIVSYHVSDDPAQLWPYMSSATNPDAIVKSVSLRLLTADTRSATLDQLLTRDLSEWSRVLASRLQLEVKNLIPGMEIAGMHILSVHPPIEVATSFLDQISARVDADKSRLEARGMATTELLRTEMMARTDVADARGAASKRLTAIVDETSHLKSLSLLDQKHPEIVRRRLYCEAFINAMEHKAITVIDAAIPPELRISIGDYPSALNDIRSRVEEQK